MFRRIPLLSVLAAVLLAGLTTCTPQAVESGNNQNNHPETVAVTSISLNKTELTLTEGESETLTTTIKPNDATDKTIIWSTSDAMVATVENGKVTALKAGVTVITAKAGDHSATCEVTVKEPDKPEGFNDEHRNW